MGSDKCNIFKQFYEYTQYFFIFGLSICHNHFDIWIPDCNQDKLEVYLWMLENRFSDNKFWKKLKGRIQSKLSTVESPLSHTMNKSKWMGWKCFRIDKRNSSFHVLKVHFSKLHPKLSVDKSFKYSTESLASKCVLYFCNIYLFCEHPFRASVYNGMLWNGLKNRDCVWFLNRLTVLSTECSLSYSGISVDATMEINRIALKPIKNYYFSCHASMHWHRQKGV